MRLIDADELKIDSMTNIGTVAVSQSQIANAPTYELNEIKDEKIRLDMEKQYFTKHILNQPCSFCESFEERHDENHIYKDEDGQFNLMADTGDSFQWGIIEDVNYCPYCGRRLAND